MSNYPHISLDRIPIDAELVRRLPRKLAYYHLALPLAADGDEVSMAMAYPDNHLVIGLLGAVLGTAIVPVQADAPQIRAALDKIWQPVKTPDAHLLSWGASAPSAQRANRAAEGLAAIFRARVTDVRDNDPEAVIAFSQQDTYTFAVIQAEPDAVPFDLMRRAATPILLLCGDSAMPSSSGGRILLSLRGHSPDLSALDWVIPLADAWQAGVTILAVTAQTLDRPATSRSSQSLAVLLDPDAEPAQHLAECTDRLVAAGVHGFLKLCQGDPIAQIVAEFAEGHYSMLVLISEAHGDFVGDVMRAINARHSAGYAVLVVKPMLAL